ERVPVPGERMTLRDDENQIIVKPSRDRGGYDPRVKANPRELMVHCGQLSIVFHDRPIYIWGDELQPRTPHGYIAACLNRLPLKMLCLKLSNRLHRHLVHRPLLDVTGGSPPRPSTWPTTQQTGTSTGTSASRTAARNRPHRLRPICSGAPWATAMITAGPARVGARHSFDAHWRLSGVGQAAPSQSSISRPWSARTVISTYHPGRPLPKST